MNSQGGRAGLGTALGITVVIALAVVALGIGSRLMQPSTPIDVATESRTPIDVASLGPQVGEQVPTFSLPDQNGQVRTVDDILGPRGAMLLFHRSADW